MEFSVNHPILFLIVGILIAVVLGQSVFFLCKALKRRSWVWIKVRSARPFVPRLFLP